MELVLKNGHVYYKGRFIDASVGIENGKIAKITQGMLNGEKEIDCGKKILLPGLIDSHVHFRVPGAEYKEDWKTGSRAAAAGGVTTVLDMPNNSPSITTNKLLELKREIAARDSIVNFGFYIGATKENADEIRNAENIAGVKIFMGASTGSLLMADVDDLGKEFALLKELGKIAVLHAEDEELIKKNSEAYKERNEPAIHAEIRDNNVAKSAMETALLLQKKARNRVHFLHVSTREEIELIKNAKREGLAVSCEATPHHLFLTKERLKEIGNFAKMNPPLRSQKDRFALWSAIEFGFIDVIGTDHAPHTKEEKQKPYWEAPAGVPGIETMLPLLLNAANEDRLTFQKLVQLCCENPARIFGIKGKGKIIEGADADLVLVDLKKQQTIRNEKLFTKCGWTPFDGTKVKGAVEKTFVAGKLVFSEGSILNEENKGREVEFIAGQAAKGN